MCLLGLMAVLCLRAEPPIDGTKIRKLNNKQVFWRGIFRKRYKVLFILHYDKPTNTSSKAKRRNEKRANGLSENFRIIEALQTSLYGADYQLVGYTYGFTKQNHTYETAKPMVLGCKRYGFARRNHTYHFPVKIYTTSSIRQNGSQSTFQGRF